MNIKKDQLRWNGLRSISTYRKANPKIMKRIYCSTVIPILLYCSEMWNLTDRILRLLEVFHDKVARELNRKKFIRFWKYRYGEK